MELGFTPTCARLQSPDTLCCFTLLNDGEKPPQADCPVSMQTTGTPRPRRALHQDTMPGARLLLLKQASGSASLPILLDCLPLALSSPRSPCCACTSHSPFPSSDGKSLALGSQDRLAAKDDPRVVAKATRRAGQTAPTVREEGDLGGSQAWSPPSHPQPDSRLGALIQGEP